MEQMEAEVRRRASERLSKIDASSTDQRNGKLEEAYSTPAQNAAKARGTAESTNIATMMSGEERRKYYEEEATKLFEEELHSAAG